MTERDVFHWPENLLPLKRERVAKEVCTTHMNACGRHVSSAKLNNFLASRPRRAPTSTSQCSGAVCEIVTD
ncbi:hypothetical protein KIN20_009819 [Parelaphostrongylus tenuis]|uniref:Uncharacterized protein n=1 Tax=Parelaphostrongylus tenuis TaxID=148309 RepID=A0AAD5M8P3_PARTN|nr:hypothetical protein KIN20_009819 [Parelaphostrongylus tenuis]